MKHAAATTPEDPTMTKDAPAFDFYPERWTHGTRHLSKVERCDYMDLLAHQWTNDGLPADLAIVARLIGYKKASQIPALVLEKFPVAQDGRRRNLRLEKERTKQRERIACKSRGAAKTNAKRWGKDVTGESLSDQSATPERPICESRTSRHLPPPTSHPKGTPIIPQGGKAEEDQQALKKPSLPTPISDPPEDPPPPPRWAPTAEQQQVAGWFRRLPTTPWSRKELRAWKAISFEPDDMRILGWFYQRSGYAFLRKDLKALLNNWRGEVERARKLDQEKRR